MVDKYHNYSAFMREFVLPRKNKNPLAIRLDLLTKNDKPIGNRTIAGVFFYPEKIQDQPYEERWVRWKVHSDTQFAPLFQAYNLICAGNPFPFRAGPTRGGKGTRLNLITDLKETPYLYIYKI